MTDVKNNNGTRKRKKKRSYAQIAKKFARENQHHEYVDSETFDYMLQILRCVRYEFPEMEDKTLFVDNVFKQTIGQELQYAKNKIGSRILDSLMDHASLEVIQRMVNAFQSSLRPLSSDKFGSHVLQKILLVCSNRGNRSNDDSIATADVESYNDIVLKLSQYFINNVEEFILDPCANHLLRTVIECLGGLIDTVDTHGKRIPLNNVKRRQVTLEFTKLLTVTCERFYKWPQFLEFDQNELISRLVQSMLYSLSEINDKLTKLFIKRIMSTYDEEKNTSNIFNHENSSRLLEASLIVAKPKTFTKLYSKFFAEHLTELCLNRQTNYSVQRLLDSCKCSELLEQIFSKISPIFLKIITMNHTGILISLANACLRLKTQQIRYITTILNALDCSNENTESLIVPCVCALMDRSSLEKLKENAKTPIKLHGSLIVQAMIAFNKPIKIVHALLAMNDNELIDLLCDQKGSRIFDAFMESQSIGEKSREKMMNKLQGNWTQLAKDVYGSRVIDKAWEKSQIKQKHCIMGELSAAGEGLRSTRSGKFIYMKLNVPLYTRNKKEWSELPNKEEKTKQLFADLIKTKSN